LSILLVSQSSAFSGSCAMPSASRWNDQDGDEEEDAKCDGIRRNGLIPNGKPATNGVKAEEEDEDEGDDDEEDEEEEEDDREELLARLAKAERDRDSLQEDIQQAQDWADRKEQEWEEKDGQFKSQMEEADKRASDAERRAEEMILSRGEELEKERKLRDGSAAAAPQESLEARLREAEAEALRQKQRATEAEQLARKAVEAARASEAMRKAEFKEQSKADRCRELQQDLENAHRELKSLKAQLRQRADDIPKDRGLREAQAPTSNETADTSSPSAEPKKPRRKGATASLGSSLGKAHEGSDNQPAVAESESVSTSTPSASVSKKAKRQQQVGAETSGGATPSAASAASSPSTAGGKIKKKVSAASAQSPKKNRPSRCRMQCTGGNIAAIALVVAVLVQAGLLVNEGLFG